MISSQSMTAAVDICPQVRIDDDCRAAHDSDLTFKDLRLLIYTKAGRSSSSTDIRT